MWLLDALRPSTSPLVAHGTRTVRDMLDTSADMFDAATACLLDNERLGVDLGAMDDRVNQGKRDVRRVVLEHLAVSPQDDLSWSLLLLSAIQDAERAGDLAKSLAKAAALASSPRQGEHVGVLRAIRDDVRAMFDGTCQAFSNSDTDAARGVMAANAGMKGRVADLLGAIAADTSLTPNEATVLALAARMIGRVASHLSNVASAVAMPFDQVRNAPLKKAA